MPRAPTRNWPPTAPCTGDLPQPCGTGVDEDTAAQVPRFVMSWAPGCGPTPRSTRTAPWPRAPR
eukprot:6590448-Prymnesium_polylepis.2